MGLNSGVFSIILICPAYVGVPSLVLRGSLPETFSSFDFTGSGRLSLEEVTLC